MGKLFGLYNESKSAVKYMIDEITYICKNIDKRAPGSKGEREGADYMASVLSKECGCDNVKVESFKEHPEAFYGYLYFSAVFDVLCAVTFFISPVLSIIFGAATMLLMLFQFVLYYEIIDIFFPVKESTNVTALRHCTGEVKQRVFICGHVDAAWEWPVNYYFGGVAFETHPSIAVIGILYYMVLSVVALFVKTRGITIAALVGFIFIPFWIGLVFLRNKNRIVDGANDNLSGCYIGISILREMEKQGINLENTEVGVIITGSEESGLRGAKAWAKSHASEYKDVPTYIYVLDTIYDPKYLAVNDIDLNGTLKSDKAMADVFYNAAIDVKVPCNRDKVPFLGGSTDSSAFTKAGFRSVAITGLNHNLERYYHTRMDTYDNMNEKGLENCYLAMVRTIEKIDSEGING